MTIPSRYSGQHYFSTSIGIRFNNEVTTMRVFVSGNIDAGSSAISADSDSDNNTVYLDRNARIEGAIRK